MTCARQLAVVALLTAGLLACGGGAGELLDTAQLEETQHNVPHARELYQELLRRYPDSPEAATAAERLRALGEPSTRPAR
jgi:hypothetical protein